tara:strand:- start:5365 stop:5634 length:270 start_codon:yes stop_codon:yes gene_type:complete
MEWHKRVNVGRALGRMFPDNYYEHSYTATQKNKVNSLNSLVDFLGVKGEVDYSQFDESRTRVFNLSDFDNDFFNSLASEWILEFEWVSG